MIKSSVLKGLTFVALAGVLSGCGTTTHQSKSSTASQKSSQTQTKRQKLISELPKGVKSSDSDLVLVNKWHKRSEMSFSKSSVNGIAVRSSIVKPLEAFLAGAKKAGYPTTVVSGYRSVAYQKEVWDQSIQTYENQGKSAKQALKLTKEFVAVPSGSEHETGLAVDIMNTHWYNTHGNQLLSSSDKNKGQQWLINHAADYGFVLRFPKDGVKSTGIDYESWHFRYVGKKSAAFMVKHNLTLEQYVSLLQAREKAGK
ncbi:D-alanyl-D-alanine carboxypeptidase family protein [Lactiplantibacillus garii]|uniref:D-alanyl-D-alanine carboxypeptidase family protein n=1 Tax=Lactiplantibacillus garii TaxID=2306423 RepID=A0A426DAM9_9LACO|nr:M15 family metallopeptidase [Lactiplantibacillus garii]RRK11688.1 D-alanyl-D-alanine carboxypeptidase family protein [Lactiplantibacillus garii]